MFRSPGGRRLVLLIRRAAATTAAGSTNRLQPHTRRLLNHYYYYTTSLARTPDPDTVSYLVASYGLSPAAAAAVASRGRRIHSIAKADAVLSLLRRFGFSDAELARLLARTPGLFGQDPDKIVGPKLEFFAALGIRAAVLARSKIFERSLDNCIIPYVGFLHGILGTDASIRSAIFRYPRTLGSTSKSTVAPPWKLSAATAFPIRPFRNSSSSRWAS
ncbi:hypothetical protein BAE44_0021547 [Dichanthelium oligosanthes]|uniref:Uncharacterized protein n=1 Tax=Dichanthelium oligosanthes TaxID=888268 RepID=A0A1E5UWX3_9POAL|nr:hypothetical protein BAE44_0021547 [Dichanthelium oligosanthes]